VSRGLSAKAGEPVDAQYSGWMLNCSQFRHVLVSALMYPPGRTDSNKKLSVDILCARRYKSAGRGGGWAGLSISRVSGGLVMIIITDVTLLRCRLRRSTVADTSEPERSGRRRRSNCLNIARYGRCQLMASRTALYAWLGSTLRRPARASLTPHLAT